MLTKSAVRHEEVTAWRGSRTDSCSNSRGASRVLGRGEVFAEVDGTFGHLDTSLGQLRTGGLFVGVGYRYRP